MALREAVRKLAASYGREYIERQAANGEKTTELWNDMGKHGYLGVSLPEEYGGGGGGIGDLAAVLEEAATAGAPLLLMVVSPAICGTIIARYGTEEQKQRWVPGIADGSITMAFAITEPDAGSNSHKITTTATKDGDDYVLNGGKTYISGVDEADYVLVVSRMADAKTGNLKPALIVVPTDAKGFEARVIPMTFTAPENQFTLHLDDVRVPADSLVGDPDHADAGLLQLFAGLNPERIMGAAHVAGHRALRARPGGGVRQDPLGLEGPAHRHPPGHRAPAGEDQDRAGAGQVAACRRPRRSTTPATTWGRGSTPTWRSTPPARWPATPPTSPSTPTAATAWRRSTAWARCCCRPGSAASPRCRAR